MARHSFIRQSKLHNVIGRVDYISNPKRQENLYAVHESVDRSFWDYLAEQNRYDFKKSGTAGQCIEARELIIALPEEFTSINPDILLKIFSEKFRMDYGVECISALHHNKAKTNFHIHLIYSERKILPQKEKKIASRNMFYDENGKHVRTKKEILDADGNIRHGCRIIPKGEAYEMNYFAPKEQAFKSKAFLQEVKEMFTGLINEIVVDEAHKQTVFDPDGPYLPTKKIGKNNPLAEEVRVDNAARQDWNRTVDEAVVSGVPESEIVEVKQEHIAAPVRSSIQKHGHFPARLREILTRAVGVLRAKIKAIRTPTRSRPMVVIDMDDFKKLQHIKDTLDSIMERIRGTDQEIATVEKELSGLSGLAGLLHGDRRSGLIVQKERLAEYRTSQATLLNSTVRKEGFKNVAAFMVKYNRMHADIASHQNAVRRGERSNVQLKKRASVNVTLQEKGRQNEQKRQMCRGDRSTERV